MKILFLLICGHALGDFALQSTTMSFGKCRDYGGTAFHDIPWYYWLTAHALIHAGIVYLITSNMRMALIELVSHWIIDFLKSEDKISLYEDQLFHVVLKIIYSLNIYIRVL